MAHLGQWFTYLSRGDFPKCAIATLNYQKDHARSYGNEEIITHYHVAMYIDCIVLEPIRIPSSSLWASSNGKMGVQARELIPTKTHRTAIQLVTSWVHLKKGFWTVASGKHLATSSSVPSLSVWFWLKYVGSHFNFHGWSWFFCPWKLLQNWG